MKVTWNNIHYIIFTLIILNFVMLYFLKGFDEESTESLEKTSIEKKPIIVLIANNESTNNDLNSSLTDTNIAEDIGKAIGDSGKSIPLLDTGIKQFLNVIGTEDKIIPPNSVLKEEYNSISTIGVMLLILVGIALCVTYFEKKLLESWKKVTNENEEKERMCNTQYCLLNDD